MFLCPLSASTISTSMSKRNSIGFFAANHRSQRPTEYETLGTDHWRDRQAVPAQAHRDSASENENENTPRQVRRKSLVHSFSNANLKMGFLEKLQASQSTTSLLRSILLSGKPPRNTISPTTDSAKQTPTDRSPAELEISRLQKRYTRDRCKRSTWSSEARYIDGEYVFTDPQVSPSSSRCNESKWANVVKIKPLGLKRQSQYL